LWGSYRGESVVIASDAGAPICSRIGPLDIGGGLNDYGPLLT